MSSFVETPKKPSNEGAPPLDATMMTAIICVAGAAVVLSVGAIVGFGWRMGSSCAAGGLLATVNLWAFAYVGRGMLGEGRRKWGLLGGLKLLALLAAFYVLLSSDLLSGLGVAAGYAALPLGVAIGNFVGPRPEDLPPEG
ncbi:MAG TPA: hypothetical protein ENK57_08795 [Polyangiaceae bacterium]|nr:hypothetical protein [Polyangiaceae bacterium]